MKEVRAWAVTDEEILKAVAKEMGLEWVDGPGLNTVAGIPVSEYLKSHSILDGDDNVEEQHILLTGSK